MDCQLNLLADAARAIDVPVSPAVFTFGARAVDAEGRPLFAHRHLPSMPSALADEVQWQAALDLAETALGGEAPTRAILDLAEAYSRLDYYGRVYGPGPWDESWRPVPLIRGLAAKARALGGDPRLLPQHADYMRERTRP